jgi:hypothetical protein
MRQAKKPLPGFKVCDKCHGTGGKGYITGGFLDHRAGPGQRGAHEPDCEVCDGMGMVKEARYMTADLEARAKRIVDLVVAHTTVAQNGDGALTSAGSVNVNLKITAAVDLNAIVAEFAEVRRLTLEYAITLCEDDSTAARLRAAAKNAQ